MNAPEDALALLDAHEASHQSDGDYGELAWVECTCGADFEDPDGYGSGYRLHRAQVLAEWVAEREAQAWDEGYEDGRDDESFDSRGSSSDPDAHLYPHANPYRARAEALGATESAGEGENGGLGGREAAGPGNRDSGGNE